MASRARPNLRREASPGRGGGPGTRRRPDSTPAIRVGKHASYSTQGSVRRIRKQLAPLELGDQIELQPSGIEFELHAAAQIADQQALEQAAAESFSRG